MVQDYQHLNQWTVKNEYSLPLIADILDGVGKRKVFTKLDLRWGYNNIRIKEGDEWKVVFTTHIGAYKSTVMYFGLTNSPAIFQVMMNNLFRDLINKGDTATFIDNILVATDTEEGHDELVEEVLKQGTSRKTNAQHNPRKTMESYISRFYHQTALSPGIRCNPSSV